MNASFLTYIASPEGAKIVPLPETMEERIEREVMEALLQSETVHATDVLVHWGEALTKKAGIEPALASAQLYYAQACDFFLLPIGTD